MSMLLAAEVVHVLLIVFRYAVLQALVHCYSVCVCSAHHVQHVNFRNHLTSVTVYEYFPAPQCLSLLFAT
jgi:hypothetical protein